jgi:glycosyltransferase involved in cell wall biosynthesis
LDRLLLPIWTLWLAGWIWRWRPRALVTVAHGYMFLAAVAAGRLCRLPVILIVHDDWVALNRDIRIFCLVTRPLFAWSLRHATHVCAISPAMASELQRHYGVAAEVQWPATSENPMSAASSQQGPRKLRLVFAGMIYKTVWESLDFLVRFLQTDAVGQDCEIHLFSNFSEPEIDRHGWGGVNVHNRGWVGQSDLKAILADADVLVLPVGFDETVSYYATTSFPSKVADYLAAGRPILVIGPQNAAAASYLTRGRCAELISELSTEMLSKALLRLMEPGVRQAMGKNSLDLFQKNHSIENQRRSFTALVQRLSRA